MTSRRQAPPSAHWPPTQREQGYRAPLSRGLRDVLGPASQSRYRVVGFAGLAHGALVAIKAFPAHAVGALGHNVVASARRAKIGD